MRAVFTQIRAAVLRRRAQTATVLLVCLLASGVSSMALTLLVRSTQPWDDAFAQYQGAHLIFNYDAAKVSESQLAATANLPGVSAAGPPRETVLVPFKRGSQKGQIALIGRPDPGGSLDRIPVVAGRWPQRLGEVIVARTRDDSIPIRPRLGETIQALTDRGTVDFKVVGEAIDLGGHAPEVDFSAGALAAWVLPGQISALGDGTGLRTGYQMAYRFQRASTTEELAADRREVEAAIPSRAEIAPSVDWLRMRQGSIWLIALMSGIIFAFTVFALLAVAVIVAAVVAGSVVGSYREIGIAKAVGFTPTAIAGSYVGQMAVPALAGGLLGMPLGALASRPFLGSSAASLSLPEPSPFDPVVVLLVPTGLVALAVLSALPPALRAGMTNSIRAMALGTAPPPSRRSRLSALLARLHAPRPLSIGAGDAFARPVRGLLTLAALTIGIATAIFAVGFQATLIGLLVDDKASYGYAQDVWVHRFPGATDGSVAAALGNQPETRVVVAQKQFTVRLAGQKDPAPLYVSRGDLQTLGYKAIEGRWFAAPGEAVVSGGIAREAHLSIGDGFTADVVGGPPLNLRVVGYLNDFNTGGRTIRTDWATLGAALPQDTPDQYFVKLRPGADGKAFAARITALAPDFVTAQATSIADISFYTNLLTGTVSGLALVLMAIAAAGVFTATRLTTQDRVRDIAVLKALGMSSGQIALMTGGSTLVLWLLAVVFGVPIGIWLQGQIWQGMVGGFGLVVSSSYAVEVLPITLALGAAFLLALLGTALPARWAAATPVAQVLRSE